MITFTGDYCCYCLKLVKNQGYIFLSLPLSSKLDYSFLLLDNIVNRYGSCLENYSFKSSYPSKNLCLIKYLIPYLI